MTAILEAISPFFVVNDTQRSIAFYRDRLGFAVTWCEPQEAPVTALVRRDGVQLFLKSESSVEPTPNCARHPHLRWDAFVYVEDPDALAAEFAERSATFSKVLADTSDRLRGFEVTDPDGYVLFFGRPRSA